MEKQYQQMFDRIQMPEERAQQMRAKLASQCSPMEKEAIPMKQAKFFRRPVMAAVIIVLVCALSVTAFAASGGFRKIVYQFASGGGGERVWDENGTPIYGSSIFVDQDKIVSPVELRDDGRLYLVADGQNEDITDQFSYTDPYIYEFTGADGLRHAFLVGGELDAIGWSEFVWDEDGQIVGGTSHPGYRAGTNDAPWRAAGRAALNLP